MFILSDNTLKSFYSGYMYMYDNELLLLLTMFSLSPRLRSRWSTCHWGLWGSTVSWLSLTPHCPVLAARITDHLALHSSTAHWKYHKIIYMYNSSISNMIKVQYYMIFYCFVQNLFTKFSTVDQNLTRYPKHNFFQNFWRIFQSI